MTHVMMGSELTGEQRECMRTIQSSGDSLLSVINSILDLSKLEAGELVLENTAFPFAEHLEDSVDTFAVGMGWEGMGYAVERRADASFYAFLSGDCARQGR